MNAHASGPRLLLRSLERNWWLLALRGAVAILFGALALVWPGLTLIALVLLYGAYALVDGIFALVAAIRGGWPAPRWWLALVGIAGVLVGAMTLLWPRITGLVLLWFIAGWAVAVGAMQIVGAIRLRKEIANEWLLIAGGILSLLFGIVLFWRPGAGALGLAFAIGAFAIAYGVLLVSLAFRLHKHEQTFRHARGDLS